MANAGTIAVSLIARTQAFENGMKKSAAAVTNFESGVKKINTTMNLFKRTMATSAIAYSLIQVAEAATEVHRQLREGKSAWDAITDAIPLLGRSKKAFYELAAEVDGYTASLEKNAERQKAFSQLSKLGTTIAEDIERLGFSGDPQKYNVLKKYEDSLSVIEDISRRLTQNKNSLWSRDIDVDKFKVDALTRYRLELEKIEAAQKKLREDKVAGALETLKEQWQEMYAEIVNGADQWDLMLMRVAKTAELTGDKFRQAKWFTDAMRELERKREGFLDAPIEKMKSFSEIGSAEVFQSANINLAGLRGNGDKMFELLETQKEMLSLQRKAFA